MKANSTKIIKNANKYLVLDTIKMFECITIEGIINHTGLSRPTVLNIIKELAEQGFVIKSGFAQSEVGRQPILYSINASSYFAIGIDVDAPPVHLVVSNLNGEPLYTTRWNIESYQDVNDIIKNLVNEINLAIETTMIDRKRILGIGLGLPAVVDIKKNRTVRISRIKGWEDIAIDKIITAKTGIEVVVRNDAHLLSIAENILQKKYENMLYVVHRAGIGMSIILNGKLYEGNMGNSGYIGHTIIVPNGNPCDCGNRGCFETYCSKRAIVTRYKQITGQTLSYHQILDLARKGEREVVEIFKTAGFIFGIGISNIIKLFDIPIVVLGDMECNKDHIFFKSIHESVLQNMQGYSNAIPRIIIGKLTENQFGLGGCHFLLQRLFKLPVLNVKA